MGQAFQAFFAFIIQLFGAAEKTASAVNNLAEWADEASGTFVDKARFERNTATSEMLKQAGITRLPKRGETIEQVKAEAGKQPKQIAA